MHKQMKISWPSFTATQLKVAAVATRVHSSENLTKQTTIIMMDSKN